MSVAALAVAAFLGIAVPWGFVAALVPSLEASDKALVTNYRGRTVFYGLGIVWLVWAGCAILGGISAAAMTDSSILTVLTLVGPLALVAFALGTVDDAYGTSAARGFRGHISAMLKGRLTTGGMKLLGVGLASLVVALVLARVAPWGGTGAGAGFAQGVWTGGTALVAGASIALTSNFVNLTDLRPGRALKVYAVLAVLGALSTALLLGARADFFELDTASRAIDLVALLLFLFGPVLAVWRFDLGERGMLGDAGANPMGAVAGALIVAGLPLAGLAAYFVLMLGLNLASERVSFSKVIAASPFLSRIDDWGRLPDQPAESAKTSPPSETNPE